MKEHAPVERQDSRSKHRPLAKVASGGSQQTAPATSPPEKGAVVPTKGAVSPAAAGVAASSAPPAGGKGAGKRTEQPRSPPCPGAGK